jgi:ribose transport system substrate-binding protein
MMKRLRVRMPLALVAAALAVGGATSSTSSAGSPPPKKVDVAAARAVIQPYIGHPNGFPVTQPLAKVPTGATIAYMDCGTPICALFWNFLQPAAKTMGVQLTRYNAGSSATTVATAYDSVVAAKPAAVISVAIDVELWKNQLKELQAMNIPVVSSGVLGTAKYGIKDAQIGEAWDQLVGKLMANYVVAKFGVHSNVAFYDVPEISFTGLLGTVFKSTLKKICWSCSVRTVHIPVATTGTTAPNLIVSDLQAHPHTTAIAFAADQTELGLPSALKLAGIHVKTIGSGPTPSNVQYVADGGETAVLAADLPVLAWTLLDQAARQMAGQPLSGLEAKGITTVQFLTQRDITFDPSQGWPGYTNFAQRFAKLWGVGP